MRFLEGWPAPGNMVLDGLGQDMVSLIKGWIARCEVSGRMTSSRKYGLGFPTRVLLVYLLVSDSFPGGFRFGFAGFRFGVSDSPPTVSPERGRARHVVGV